MLHPILPIVAGLSTLAISLTSCSTPDIIPYQPGPEGRLAVMGPDRNFNLDAPPADWIISSDADTGGGKTSGTISSVTIEGVPALEIKSGPKHIIAVRNVNAMMLATPFLSWAWHLSNHGEGIHPVRLVVGFRGGAPQDTELGSQGGDLPPHDRALALVWGDTALRRGTLSLPTPEQPLQAPIYTVRGGRENTRKWWLETVDLAELYAKSWPNDEHRRVRITFIGLAAAPTSTVVRGRVSGILLTH